MNNKTVQEDGTVCEVEVCERISPDGGVCEPCIIVTMNHGENNQCKECEEFLCDHCGDQQIVGYMGGDCSAFLCCEKCWDEVSKLTPAERDYQQRQTGQNCLSCRLKGFPL